MTICDWPNDWRNKNADRPEDGVCFHSNGNSSLKRADGVLVASRSRWDAAVVADWVGNTIDIGHTVINSFRRRVFAHSRPILSLILLVARNFCYFCHFYHSTRSPPSSKGYLTTALLDPWHPQKNRQISTKISVEYVIRSECYCKGYFSSNKTVILNVFNY